MNESKHDCRLTILNPDLQSIDHADGLFHLFTHEYRNHLFWHGAVELVEGLETIKKAFDLGQHTDIKIRVVFDDQIGLAKLLWIHVDRRSEIDHATVGITGINKLGSS